MRQSDWFVSLSSLSHTHTLKYPFHHHPHVFHLSLLEVPFRCSFPGISSRPSALSKLFVLDGRKLSKAVPYVRKFNGSDLFKNFFSTNGIYKSRPFVGQHLLLFQQKF